MKSLAVAAFSAQSKVSKIMFEASYSALDSTWATGVVPSCGTGCFRCSHLEVECKFKFTALEITLGFCLGL